ncbi:hypothetical protein A7982_13770 [Minicystis rosea]|nr:hypothetical protein A7982_13770 [Minicystis rosea]
MDAPRLPQHGTITSFSYGDGIGRIRLEDGTELKVGASGLKEVVSFSEEERPLVGVRVEVHVVAPHPLGGFRATKVTRVGKEISFKRVSSPEQWEKNLRAAGLSAEHATKLRAAVRPAARLSTKKGSCPVGGSKLGGLPDAPADFAWPTIEGRPLVFVAQLRLADVPASVTRDLDLPPEGLLAFFFGAEAGRQSEPLPRARLALFDAAKALAPMKAVDAHVFDPKAITAKELWTPPPLETASEILGKDENAKRIYEAALMDFERATDRTPAHRVGGHPQPVQSPMEQRNERLLLQVDSDDACEMCWEDAGRLYFLFRKSAGFESARCEVQSG